MFQVFYFGRWLFDIPADEAAVFKAEGHQVYRQNEAFKAEQLGL